MTESPDNGQFKDDNFMVQTGAESDAKIPGTVEAKYLKDMNGNYIIDSQTGKPYVVPADYDPQAVIKEYSDLFNKTIETLTESSVDENQDIVLEAEIIVAATLGAEFRSKNARDLQTAYDGKVNAPMVHAFTAGANFNFGLAAAAGGNLRSRRRMPSMRAS